MICENCGKKCRIITVREDCDDGVTHSLGHRVIKYEVSDCCESNVRGNKMDYLE
jgi:hypothetical protein